VDVEFVSNVYQEDHRPVIQCNVRDITARRQLERVKAHTEALADLHRRKDEFLAMLSHELRNPLAPLLNAVYILGSEPGTESPMRRQARAIIERQVGVLKVLVDDLLEVSRITTGRVRLHQERLDLRNVLAQAVESARSVINQHQHALTVEQPPEAIWLHGDATRLEQVVVNLLTNAAKYTTDKGRITVTLRREGTVAVLRVRDTGEGISPDFVPHVFDLYSQADQSLERSGGDRARADGGENVSSRCITERSTYPVVSERERSSSCGFRCSNCRNMGIRPPLILGLSLPPARCVFWS
jgi:signal transduction histidine kinase